MTSTARQLQFPAIIHLTMNGRHIAMHRKSRDSGFTLMELLIVLVILGLLAAFVAPSLYQRVKPAKKTMARGQIQSFMTALDNYFIDNQSYPSTMQGLQALRKSPRNSSHWQGPYLNKKIPMDPWGNPYIYRSPGRNGGYEIISLGKDGIEGGEGENSDIKSWE